MGRFVVSLLVGTALAGCAAQTAPVAVVSAEAVAPVEAPVAAAPAPKSEIGTFGFDMTGMDTSVSPGDSFYKFANGTWAQRTEIPSDKAYYGMFNVLDDLSRERTRVIIEEQAKDPASKIGIAYNTFLDTAAIDAQGMAPIQAWLNEIREISSKSGYAAIAGKANRLEIGGPIGLFVGQDDKSPDRYIGTFTQGGIGLPDRDYYLSSEAKMADIRTKYADHLAKLLTLAGESDAARRAKAIVDFETRIAKVHWTRVDSRDATKTYNLLTRSQFATLTRGFDSAAFLDGLGLRGAQDMLVSQPSAIRGISGVVASAPLSVLKDQLIVRSLKAYSAELPSAVDKENFAFDGTTLSGTPEQRVRWKRAVDFTTGALGDDVSQLYVARHFPPETKATADTLVKNVVAAMGRRLDALSWMAPETKVRAHAKLANFRTKIGYPDRWQDYGALAIRPGDALGNAMRAAEWRHADAVSKLGGPIRRWEWGMRPMDVNAYANFTMQEIVFPAAILQPPFFDPHADPALNYGGIGAVIGHEISHHFDDQGAKYDENGRLNDWWTPADVKAFEAAGKALIAQYDVYEVLPGARVKGALTLGENIGDLAGLTIAYDAYHSSLNGVEAPVLEGTTGDQRFYLGWAQVWRCKVREPLQRQLLIVDPHSPCEQRTAVVRNLDPWNSAFDVKPGQQLHLPPEKRVRTW